MISADSAPADTRDANLVIGPTNDSIATSADFLAYSEWCWSQLYPHDYQYLTEKRVYPRPCTWCGGRMHHNPLCEDLQASWQPALPFGRYKGKALSDVPHEYLEWFATIDGIDAELRDAIQLVLQPDQ
jgi:uncharacterized protein (DUF3820 family)